MSLMRVKRKGKPRKRGPLRVADHEYSRTDGPNAAGRYENFDTVGPNAGIKLGPKGGFNSLEDAVSAAKARSAEGHSKKKKVGKTPYYPRTYR